MYHPKYTQRAYSMAHDHRMDDALLHLCNFVYPQHCHVVLNQVEKKQEATSLQSRAVSIIIESF